MVTTFSAQTNKKHKTITKHAFFLTVSAEHITLYALTLSLEILGVKDVYPNVWTILLLSIKVHACIKSMADTMTCFKSNYRWDALRECQRMINVRTREAMGEVVAF